LRAPARIEPVENAETPLPPTSKEGAHPSIIPPGSIASSPRVARGEAATYGYSVLMVEMSVLFIPVRWPIWLFRPRLETMVGWPLLLNAVVG
jgi:hypothetical protein